MLVDDSDPRSFHGRTLHDASGAEVGQVTEVFEDGLNPHTYWVGVRHGGRLVLVPSGEIRPGEGGPAIPYSLAVLTGAPDVTPSNGEVVGADVTALVDYYGQQSPEPTQRPAGEP